MGSLKNCSELCQQTTATLQTSGDSEVVYQPNNKEQLHYSLREAEQQLVQVSSLAMANLSLEEVGHIRSVPPRQIEALPDEGSTKKNVKAGRQNLLPVRETKFGLFSAAVGSVLSRKSQAVCSKCAARASATPPLHLPVADYRLHPPQAEECHHHQSWAQLTAMP